MKKAWGVLKHSTNDPYPSQSLWHPPTVHSQCPLGYVTCQTLCKNLYTHDLISSSQQPYGVHYVRTPFPRAGDGKSEGNPASGHKANTENLSHFTLLPSNFLQRWVLSCFWFLNSYLDVRPYSISNSIHQWIPWHSSRSHSFRCLGTILYPSAKHCQYSYTMKKMSILIEQKNTL